MEFIIYFDKSISSFSLDISKNVQSSSITRSHQIADDDCKQFSKWVKICVIFRFEFTTHCFASIVKYEWSFLRITFRLFSQQCQRLTSPNDVEWKKSNVTIAINLQCESLSLSSWISDDYISKFYYTLVILKIFQTTCSTRFDFIDFQIQRLSNNIFT